MSPSLASSSWGSSGPRGLRDPNLSTAGPEGPQLEVQTGLVERCVGGGGGEPLVVGFWVFLCVWVFFVVFCFFEGFWLLFVKLLVLLNVFNVFS